MTASSSPSVACIYLPALPLQALLIQHPQWRARPVVVVHDDRPLARVAWANPAARKSRISEGMKLSEAQALSPTLYARSVPKERVTTLAQTISQTLQALSPRIEIDRQHHGTFWASLEGLHRLYADHRTWAQAALRKLRALKLKGTIAVGFRAHHLYPISRVTRGIFLSSNEAHETQLAHGIPLRHLDLPDRSLAALARLNIHTVGRLLQLPFSDVALRYGDELKATHLFLSGCTPQTAERPKPRTDPDIETDIDPPDATTSRLLFCLRRMLHPLQASLRTRGLSIARIDLCFILVDQPPHSESITPSAPTLDTAQLVELLRLRLDRVRLSSPVRRMILQTETVPAHAAQLSLIDMHPQQSEAALARAIARVRAAFGETAVCCAKLQAGHLPEERFRWEKEKALTRPRPPAAPTPLLVRRFYSCPVPLRSSFQHREGHRLQPPNPSLQNFGPYVLDGGWWHQPFQRAYFYAETHTRQILWIYYDQLASKWSIHGRIE